ncbi:MAG: hypothetical protein WCQ50_22605 [Spirochaetota bacterium]
MLPAEHRLRQCFVEKALFQEEPNYPSPPELLESVACPDRNEEKVVMAVESTLKHYRVPMRMNRLGKDYFVKNINLAELGKVKKEITVLTKKLKLLQERKKELEGGG